MRLALVAFTFVAFSLPAAAQEEAIMDQIEALHGQSIEFGEAYGALQDAFLFDDPTAIAALAAYPLEVAANGELYDVLSEDDLVENFDALLTEETLTALASQDFADLIVTSDGVGFADGALWMTNICFDDACSDTGWRIVRINN